MEKLVNLLSKLNILLIPLFDGLGRFFNGLVPGRVKSTYANISNKKQETLGNIENKIQTRIDKGRERIDHLKSQAKEIDFQKELNTRKENTINFAKALNAAKVMAFFSGIFSGIWLAWRALLGKLNPNFVLSSLVVGSIGLVSGIQAFKSSNQISKELSKEPERIVASVPAGRASYYKGERKHIFIADLKVPMYLKNGHKDMKSLRMEFVFETSSRASLVAQLHLHYK